MTGEPDHAGRVAFALGHIDETFAGTKADGLESLNALVAQRDGLEQERDDLTGEWIELQARVAELERARDEREPAYQVLLSARNAAYNRNAALTDALRETADNLHEASDGWPTPNHYTTVVERARNVLAAAGEPEADTP